MAPLLLALLAGVTAPLLVGAEGPPLDPLPVGAGGSRMGTRWGQRPPDTEDGLQLSHGDLMAGSDGAAQRGGALSLRCGVCKRVVTALKGVVVNPKDEAGVARVTDRVCGRLPAGGKLCRRLLRRALALIEAALKQHQTPARLCAHLRWCPAPP